VTREYRRTAPAERTAARRPTRAETGKAARQGRDEPARLTLRRHVSTAAASAASTTEFFAKLEQAGVLIRLRYSTRNPGQVTGYAVALNPSSAPTRPPPRSAPPATCAAPPGPPRPGRPAGPPRHRHRNQPGPARSAGSLSYRAAGAREGTATSAHGPQRHTVPRLPRGFPCACLAGHGKRT